MPLNSNEVNVLNKLKKIFMQVLPVIVVTFFTLILSMVVYQSMIDAETEDCWDTLDIATEVMAGKIESKFSDNINLLERVADVIAIGDVLEREDAVLEYLNKVRDTTLFERIDILFPDETILLQVSGKRETIKPQQLTYSEVLARGAHFSTRVTDTYSQKEVIFYVTPIVGEDGKVKAQMFGMIDCIKLKDVFPTLLYNGTGVIFLIDRKDGSFLIDDQEEFRNLKELGSRKVLEGYEKVDLKKEILAGKEGNIAFVSRGNGQDSYMKYMPVEGYSWQLCYMVQGDMVFKNVHLLSNTLTLAGIIISALVLIYLGWSIFVANLSVKNEERARQAEVEQMKNEAKSRFLSNMSHDIRTPLNGIIGMLDIIKAKGYDPETLKYALHNIEVSTNYLETLANDVLDLNELDNGKIALSEQSIDLYEFIDDVSSLLMSKIKNSGISYSTDCDRISHRYVLGSTVHLHRILVNLITNAIKYNRKKGSIKVAVEEINGGGTFSFSVADTGVGMTEEFQKHMFNAFEQEQSGARSKHQGYGLGLSIVKRLVDAMNGKIEVKSKKGEGSTFTVTLSLKIDQNRNDSDIDDVCVNDISGVNILLVEDNELNMEIAKTLLSDIGANITTAVDGHIAFEEFLNSERYYFDVILMDMMLPEMDGCEATKAIRALDRPDAKRVPIIAMTANTFAEDIARCKEAGMNEHVAKPIDMPALIAKISKYVVKYRIERGEIDQK